MGSSGAHPRHAGSWWARACSDPRSPTSSRAWHRASFSPRPSQTLRQARATEFSFSHNTRPAFHLLQTQTQGGAPPRPAAPRASPGLRQLRVWRLPCCSPACGVRASRSEGTPAVSHPSRYKTSPAKQAHAPPRTKHALPHRTPPAGSGGPLLLRPLSAATYPHGRWHCRSPSGTGTAWDTP